MSDLDFASILQRLTHLFILDLAAYWSQSDYPQDTFTQDANCAVAR